MHRRKWDAKTKAIIVLEGLKGKPVAGTGCQTWQEVLRHQSPVTGGR
jgi:hypothetical protein